MKEKSRIMVLGGANSPEVMYGDWRTPQEISVVPAQSELRGFDFEQEIRAAVEICRRISTRDVERGEQSRSEDLRFQGDLKSGCLCAKRCRRY